MRVLIAGGGLAGAAAAAALARAGVAVTVIERETGPHDKICGEFISYEAQSYLAKLGLDIAKLGGHAITHVRLVRGARMITARLPFQGIGLSRKTLDEALLNHAAAQGATLHRGHTVRKICSDAMEISELGALRPETMFVATGKHELRGLRREIDPPDLIGFKMYFLLRPAQRAELARHVELLLFEGGYAGLQMGENDQANLCLLVNRARLQRARGKWADLLAGLTASCPHLAARLEGATPLLEAPLSIARIPYGFSGRPPDDPPSLFRLGDQAAVINSFTGDGMSIALHSAALAVKTVLRSGTSAEYHRQLKADVGPQITRASTLYKMVMSTFLQPAIFAGMQAWPASLAMAAKWTRIPEKSLQNQQYQNHQKGEAKTAAVINAAGANK